MEERISELEDRNPEMIQVEEEKKLELRETKNSMECSDAVRRSTVRMMGAPGRGERRLKEITDEISEA